MNKILAVRIDNQDKFKAYINYLIGLGYSTNTISYGGPMSGWTFEDKYDHEYIEFKNDPGRFTDDLPWISNYECISFEAFSQLTGVKVLEKPKEIILRWEGSFVNVIATVRKSHIHFEMSKNVVNLVFNHTQLTELFNALKSLENEN